MPVFLVTITVFVILRNVVLLFYATLSNVQYVIKNSVVTLSTFKLLFHHMIIIINNSICLRHISSNKTIQRRITVYMNIQITLK